LNDFKDLKAFLLFLKVQPLKFKQKPNKQILSIIDCAFVVVVARVVVVVVVVGLGVVVVVGLLRPKMLRSRDGNKAERSNIVVVWVEEVVVGDLVVEEDVVVGATVVGDVVVGATVVEDVVVAATVVGDVVVGATVIGDVVVAATVVGDVVVGATVVGDVVVGATVVEDVVVGATVVGDVVVGATVVGDVAVGATVVGDVVVGATVVGDVAVGATVVGDVVVAATVVAGFVVKAIDGVVVAGFDSGRVNANGLFEVGYSRKIDQNLSRKQELNSKFSQIIRYSYKLDFSFVQFLSAAYRTHSEPSLSGAVWTSTVTKSNTIPRDFELKFK
jgi:hypothetical protein